MRDVRASRERIYAIFNGSSESENQEILDDGGNVTLTLVLPIAFVIKTERRIILQANDTIEGPASGHEECRKSLSKRTLNEDGNNVRNSEMVTI